MVDAVIRIFESTATDFRSNGLGFLSDAISCQVTEERNGEFELEMEYPITGIHYSEIMSRRILVAKSNPYSNPQPFRIYEVTKPINGKVTIYAEHISYDLSGIPLNPFSATNIQEALIGLKNNAMINCPFNFLSDKTTTANFSITLPVSIRSMLGGVEGSILDIYRGEYEFDGFDVKLWNNRGLDRGATIRYGKNMTGLEQNENVSDLYTAVIPYWYSDIDEEEDDKLVRGGIVQCPGTYNFQRIFVLDCSYDFQNKPTVEQLNQFAESYINNNNVGIPKISIDVSFVNLSDSEEYQQLAALTTVHLCDTVTVEYVDLGIKATGKCIKTKYNVLKDVYNSIEIGDAKPSLVTTIVANNDKLADDFKKGIITNMNMSSEEYDKKLNETYTDLIDVMGSGFEDLTTLIETSAAEETTKRDQAIANATKTITGNLGGYIVLHSSTNADYPDEILIMDNPDITKAQKIWRWNKSGLGYSTTGYNGTYGLAITQDGSIVADYIKSGALDAALITTGFLNAGIIRGGTLLLGGQSNTYGTLVLHDAKGNVIGNWTKDGIYAEGDLILAKKLSNVNHVAKMGEVTHLRNGIVSETEMGLSIDNLMYLTANGLYGNNSFNIQPIFDVSQKGSMDYIDMTLSSGPIGATEAGQIGTFAYFGLTHWSGGTTGLTFLSYTPKMGLKLAGRVSMNGFGSDGLFMYALIQSSSSPNAVFVEDIQNDGKYYRLLRSTSSSIRYKKNVRDMTDDDISDLYKIQPVFAEFKDGYIQESDERYHVQHPMFIAENIDEYLPEAVDHNENGEPENWNVRILIPAMFQMIKSQKEQIDTLMRRVEELERKEL